MIINAALSGAVPTKADNPMVPITPGEIAADAIACCRAGASIVHIHVRDSDGHPVHDRRLYAETIGLIRDEVPELVVCVTTSGRVDPDIEARCVGLDLEPPLRPDMASLTLGSFNFPKTVSLNPPKAIKEIAFKMQAGSIRPELEVFEEGMVNLSYELLDRGLIVAPLYFNILLGSLGSAPAFVGTLAHLVSRLPPGSEWAAGGIGRFQRPMVIAGAVMGGNVRTGLEDSLTPVAPGTATNVEAVKFAVRAAELVGREIATPAETRHRLGLHAQVPA